MKKATKTKTQKNLIDHSLRMKEVMNQVKDLISKGALFFISHSGGKDSQAMFNFLKTIVPKNQIIVVHSHLPGVEWEGVVEHIKATISGCEFHEVKAGKSFLEMVEARGMWPSSKTRQCTSDLKRDPIAKLIRAICSEREASIAVNCTGIRAAESSARSKKDPMKMNKKLTTKTRTVWDLMPIFNWSTEDVFGFIRKSGQEPHWAYSVGMSRLSCCFCIMASKADLRISAKHNPKLLEEISRLEKKIGHTMFMVKGQAIGIKEYIAA